MFTSAVHAAPPHTNRMDIGSSWEGFALPDPPKGAGPGCAGLRPASAEVWGNPVSPPPSPRAYVHGSRPCGSAAQRRNEHTFVLGRAAPSQTLPQVGEWENPVSPFPCGAGAWGNPVSPCPSSRAYVHVRTYAVAFRRGGVHQPVVARPRREGCGGCAGPLATAGGKRGMRGGCASPRPSTANIEVWSNGQARTPDPEPLPHVESPPYPPSKRPP